MAQSSHRRKRRSNELANLLLLAGMLAWVAAFLTTVGCSRSHQVEQTPVSAAVTQTSASCRECHEEEFSAWQGTDHALANRPIDPVGDKAAFTATRGISEGGTPFAFAWRGARPHLREKSSDGSPREYPVDFILGHKPLWQPLVPAPGGRLQPMEMAFDPHRREWFNIFGQENRQPGEWGHWTGRGMNWNSMCAGCHMTGYAKNYDAANDRYASTWVEHGVGCIQCHGAMPTDHNDRPKKPGHSSRAPATGPPNGEREMMMQTCAPCHARNEPLTDNFQPRDNYHDHYRLTLPTDPRIFHPDGQQRDEVFNWTSFLLSRMGGHGGVSCLDCHDPHSTKTILPAGNNQLCLQCHAAPGRVQPNGVRAVPIDPLAHSHHQDGSAGNSCVACHMPTTTYMQRAPRHDHRWSTPDPLLNRELGIPDACSRCHTDKPVDWSVAAAEKRYGAKLENHQRRRTRAINAAQTGRPEAMDQLLALWPVEDIPAWRATMLELLAPYAGDARVATLAESALGDTDPLVRASAIGIIGRTAAASRLLTPMLKDSIRLVRLEAAWALSSELPADSAARRELDAYLKLGLDQPSGLLRIGQDLANRGRLAEAEGPLARAASWDPHSPGIRQSLGLVLSNLGRPDAAATQLALAADFLPADGVAAQDASLAYAEAGNSAEAERYLRLAVERDPNLHRAWYNLGLLLAQHNRLAEAMQALQRAERIAPAVADYPYALATVIFRTGDKDGALAAAQRALLLEPNHQGALNLIRSR